MKFRIPRFTKNNTNALGVPPTEIVGVGLFAASPLGLVSLGLSATIPHAKNKKHTIHFFSVSELVLNLLKDGKSAFFIFLLMSCFSIQLCSQSIPPTNTHEYQQLKKSGQLPKGPVMILNKDTFFLNMQAKVQQPSSTQSSVACDCMLPIDASFQVVPMPLQGVPPDYRNDDGSSGQIIFPFNFCFYGQTMNDCFINNNGNISFGASYGTFTANSFPDPNFIMIAPFWGDVDTRNLFSGLVYYKITPTYMVVHWKVVDYFNSDPANTSHQSLHNDFQLIVTNGSDPILPSGNNVSFCYGDMQWTTGDASSGVNGFGGSPATVGVNRGNGVDYIQIGQFDQAGTIYDGPFGNPDGVSWLDNQTFYFDVCNNGSGNNLPPIVNSASICDTMYMCIGDTIDISATFLSPEQGQITSAVMNTTCMGFTIVNNVPGNPAVIDAQLIANTANVGLNTITIIGTDNGLPPASTSVNVFVNIVNLPNVNFSVYPPAPQISGTTIQFTDLSLGAISWLWDFGDGNTSVLQNPQHTFVSVNDSVFIVTLTIQLAGGCTGTDTVHFLIAHEPLPLSAPNVVTPNGDGVNDFLEFKNLVDYPKSKLEVYNRWGNLIYSNFDYHNDWKPNVVDGTYYYVLSWPYDKKPLRGFFTVIK